MVATVEHHSHDPVPSRWPIIAAIGVGLVPVGLVANAHGWKGGLAVIGLGLLIALNSAGRWWGELLRDKFFGRDAIEALLAVVCEKPVGCKDNALARRVRLQYVGTRADEVLPEVHGRIPSALHGIAEPLDGPSL